MATETRPRPGWYVTAAVAPCAAAVFGAAVFWAADTPPSTASTTATASTATSSTAPASAAPQARAIAVQQQRQLRRELEHVLAEHRQELARLEARLRQVRTAGRDARQALQFVPPPVSYQPVAAVPAQAPAAAPVAAPAAAPPVQATTGASGAVR